MISRYFILSGIPLSQLTIIDEIQNMISYLIENLGAANSKRMPEKGMKNSFFFYFFIINVVLIFNMRCF